MGGWDPRLMPDIIRKYIRRKGSHHVYTVGFLSWCDLSTTEIDSYDLCICVFRQWLWVRHCNSMNLLRLVVGESGL
ncbi:hypothetical protein PM082_024086 [Marasmius tenuissimus]|nr:hypothetical protein PM082_024086 [Marasmius tenuissimus]